MQPAETSGLECRKATHCGRGKQLAVQGRAACKGGERGIKERHSPTGRRGVLRVHDRGDHRGVRLSQLREPGDPAGTATGIAAAELTYRAGILLGFVTHVIFIVLVVILYQLFQDVDRSQALLMVLFVAVGVAVAFANLLNRFAPLVLGGGAEYLSAFSKPQLDALALAWLGFRSSGSAVPLLFWGLWLFPFGILVIKSGFLPRFLGILLLVAGVGYLTSGVTSMLLPEYRALVFRWMTPLYLGEVPIIFWLLIKGAAGGSPRP